MVPLDDETVRDLFERHLRERIPDLQARAPDTPDETLEAPSDDAEPALLWAS